MRELTTFLREREGRPVNIVHQGYATACTVASKGIPSWIVYSSWLQGAHSRVEKTSVMWVLCAMPEGNTGGHGCPKEGHLTQTDGEDFLMPALRLGG